MPPAPPVIKIVLLLSFMVKYPSKLWDHRQSCEEALRRSTQTQRPPDARGDRVRAAYAGQPCPGNAARSGRLSSTFPHDVIGGLIAVASATISPAEACW